MPTRLPGRFSVRRASAAVFVVAASIGLFMQYLRIARGSGTNADGASIALQAWDVLHGNVLLHGWTLSDVPFYTTELLQHALLELIVGYHADVVHVAAAMTYTMLVILVAVLAKGRATGLSGVVRMAVAVAFMIAPTPGIAQLIVLTSPNHTGTVIPLLITWIVLDRALTRRDGEPRETQPRWLPYAIAVLQVWGEIGDPLVSFVGALPLVVVCALRLWGSHGPLPHRWRGLDARLLVAGVLSVVVAHGFVAAARLAGGFYAIPAEVRFAPLSQLGQRASMTVAAIAVIFGGYPPELHGPAAVALGLLHLVGVLAVIGALGVVLVRALRRPSSADGAVRRSRWASGDRVNEILAVGIVVNIAAYLVSTLPLDLGGGREIIAVLPLGAALVARVFATRVKRLRLLPAVTAVLVVLTVAMLAQPLPRASAAENQDVADWLVVRNLTYGVGNYWTANNITLTTSGRVQVVPVLGGTPIMAYHRESRADWYDAAHHDARFIVVDAQDQGFGIVDAAIAQFGKPIERHDFTGAVVLLYDHNLLVGLPDHCADPAARSSPECY
jgi:hypothetical protein